MKLKGLLFGKSLKQLFIILLISCFTFGLGCFTSAGYTRQVGTYGYNPYLQSLDINLTRAGNPLTSSLGYTKQIFVIQQTTSDFCAWFWNNGLPYNYCTRRTNKQGNIQSYQVCSEILDISQTTKPGNCVNNIVGDSTREIFKNFLASLTTDDYYWFNYYTTDFGWGEFCISNHSVSSSFCFNFNSSSNSFTNTLNLTGGLSFDSFPTSVLENPPSSASNSSGSLNPDSEVIFYSDNNQIYFDTFQALGYYTGLCYSNFNLTDRIDIYTAYYDLFPSPSAGNGANVFDLYSDWVYFQYNPFRAWYSFYNNKYNQLESSSDRGTNYIMSLYSGASIGNFYLFEKLNNNSYLDSYTFSIDDYESFCSMVVNGFNPDGLFTGKTSISFDNIMSSQPCIRNGTCIGNVNGATQFILSGADGYGMFSGSDSYVEVFNKIYSNVKTFFKVDTSLNGTSGLLPSYVIFGFLVFVLYYVLKR